MSNCSNKIPKIGIIGCSNVEYGSSHIEVLKEMKRKGLINLIIMDKTKCKDRGIRINEIIIDDIKLTLKENIEIPFIKKTKKSYNNRNVKRYHRQSRW